MSLSDIAGSFQVAGVLDSVVDLIFKDQRWENPEDGPHNVVVGVSGKKFSWGDQPPYDRIDELRETCLSVGCSDLSTIEFASKIIAEENDLVQDVTIQLSADAEFFESSEQANMDYLFDMAMDVASGVGEVKRAFPGTIDGGSSGACSQWSFNCQREPVTHDQYLTANVIMISVRNKETDGIIATLTITAEIQAEGDDACSDFLDGAGAIAGAVNGVGGGLFSLASLFCGM